MILTDTRVIDRIGPTREPVGQRVAMRQTWADLLFLHWAVPSETIARLLPPGLTVDTFAGQAYVGLVPFTMRGVRPVWSPPVRGLSNFHETNVRTYVVDERGNPGVWFFSLDAANPVAVAIARGLWLLPYHYAAMEVRREPGGIVDYRSRRLRPGPLPAESHVRCAVNGTPAPAPRDTLEFFLAERYILFAAGRGGTLWSGRVHHTPYPLQTALVETLDDSLVAAAQITVPNTAPLAHYAAQVDVRVYPLRKLRP